MPARKPRSNPSANVVKMIWRLINSAGSKANLHHLIDRVADTPPRHTLIKRIVEGQDIIRGQCSDSTARRLSRKLKDQGFDKMTWDELFEEMEYGPQSDLYAPKVQELRAILKIAPTLTQEARAKAKDP